MLTVTVRIDDYGLPAQGVKEAIAQRLEDLGQVQVLRVEHEMPKQMVMDLQGPGRQQTSGYRRA